MYYKNVGYLLEEKQELDARRKPIKTYVKRKVFCNIKSVGYNEFFQAQVVGYRPEIKVELRCIDVSKYTHFTIGDKLYKIIRSYVFQDKVELTLNSVVIDNENKKD